MENSFQASSWAQKEEQHYSSYAYYGKTDNFKDIEVEVDGWNWTWMRTLKLLIFSPIVLFTILGNLLVLFAFLTRKRELRSPTHFFIANLSLADFLVGVLVLPFLATVHVTDRWYFGQNFCYAWIIIHFWLCSASILSTCAVCIERYTGVKYPLKHLNIMSRNRVYIMIFFVWVFAGIMTISSVVLFPEEPTDDPYGCKINMQIGHVLIATIGILYIPAAIMVVLYWRIYVIASKHLKDMKKAYGQPMSTSSGGKVKTTLLKNSKDESGISSGIDTDHESEVPSKTFPPAEVKLSYGQRVALLFKPKLAIFKTKDVELGERPSEMSSVSNDVGSSSGCSVLESGNSSSNTNTNSQKKQINLAKKLAILVSVLLLSYVPFFTVFLIRAFSLESVPDWLFITLGWIRYANSCINPIIYAYAVPAYRKAFQGILSGKFLR